ncbi:MAG: hypothetical protein LKI34_02790 [Bifidobacterium tibiigranuli]|jgi:hypothetical protein|uniref:hypothetical protein n=1 Tax=Bifidobacterium tibiigranuli TaxID=2172043 RepID=UPI0026E9C2BC|nr:hypothetical protein [Bifidobacterium tibiigranuli]MCI1673133.1 hypothetical protein [Bifidobacterium tibiigranuli]MCI1713622.1 hypothetical protein [Bifidobacterium tibiigranuli]
MSGQTPGIRNMCMDPECTQPLRLAWQSAASQNADGTWTYSLAAGTTNGTICLSDIRCDVGDIMAVQYAESYPTMPVLEHFAAISYMNGLLVAQAKNPSTFGTINVTNPLTPLAMLHVTATDWQRLQSMGVNWFDGSSMPKIA